MLLGTRFVRFARGTIVLKLQNISDGFERYTEIENSNANRIRALKEARLFNDEWIATEKIHGANFGIYSFENGKTIRYAKRSGIMPPNEHFFGYHILIPDLQRWVNEARALLSLKLGISPQTVVLNGELFGGKYDHPSVRQIKKSVMVGGRSRMISPVQNDSFPQYSPNLHFYAFDLKYRESDSTGYRTLTYDEGVDIFEKVSGLLYARSIIRGPMSKITAFDVENFQTTIPPQVGMGNYPLKGNWAEGLVVKHSKRGKVGFDPKGLTILKLKCTAFQEISVDPREGPRVDEMESIRESSIAISGVQLPEMESVIRDREFLEACKHLLNHICMNRLKNVLSKIGTEPLESRSVTPDDVATLLAEDALKDFLKEASPNVLAAPIITRRDMTRYVVFEARKLVHSYWKEIGFGQKELDG